MLRRINLALALLVAAVACALSSSTASAGWGHHHHGWGHHHGRGHHHHGWGHRHIGYGGLGYGGLGYGGLGYGGLGYGGLGYGGLGYGGLGYRGISYNSWGYPGFGVGRYSSFSIGFPRSYSSYGFGSSYGYGLGSSLGLGYSSYYAPSALSYSVSMPSYYVTPPTYYYAPMNYQSYVSPSYSNYCDPCATCGSTTIGIPGSTAPGVQAPVYSPDDYSTGIAPLPSPSGSLLTRSVPMNTVPRASIANGGSMVAGGSMVDRMLGRSSGGRSQSVANVESTKNAHARSLARVVNNPVAQSNLPSRASSVVQRVSTTKPLVTPDLSIPRYNTKLTPMPAGLLESADAIFAAGGYSQAASAYAKLTVRYGNHDQLAVRRFLALVASGDCDQAAVVFELATLSGQGLSLNALPAGGLSALYGTNATVRQQHVDYLADFAMKHSTDSLPLSMVGTWLVLDGQPERAELFLNPTSQRAPKRGSLVVTPDAAAHLVATELAR